MPYIMLALAVAGFGSGYWVADSINSARISDIKASISLANLKAMDMAKAAKAALKRAEAEAAGLETELEKTHESDISTINYYHDLLVAARLPKPARDKGCRDGLPKAKNTLAVHEDEADRADIPEGLVGLLKEESYRADQAAVEKNALLKFTQANCGVK